MKDYTEIFSKAIELSSGYNIKNIAKIINSIENTCCDESDEWGEYHWHYIFKEDKNNRIVEIYGYLSCYYPVALIKENCPDTIKRIFSENNILFTEFEEPMCCNEDILREYVDRRVIDEAAFLNSDYSFDDEIFDLILYRIEKGSHCYIDASDFMFEDIFNN